MKTQVGWMYSIIFCVKYVCDQLDNMVISGDFNLPDILWDNVTGLFFKDHSIIIFQFNAFRKAPPKILRFVYDYAKDDFEGPRTALSAVSAINLFSMVANDDIITDWHQCKDTFLAAVSDYVQTKRLKGRNPTPWTSGAVLNLIKKKEFIKQ